MRVRGVRGGSPPGARGGFASTAGGPPGLRVVRLVALASLVAAGLSAAPTMRVQAGPAAGPNVLIIVTDDQRPRGTIQVMPRTRHWFGSEGTRFSNGYVTTPLCCPSRASIMTGRYAHGHGVNSNGGGPSGAAALDQASTIQRYLAGAGYRTGIVGKFLNGWRVADDPPYFDRWAIFPGGYHDRPWNVDGSIRSLRRYSTHVIRSHALRFLDEAEGDDARPWFLYVATAAPHVNPIAEPAYAGAPVGRWDGNPAVREEDRTDKPAYVRAASRRLSAMRAVRRKQLRSLMSVDDLVDAVMRRLEATGEEDTLAFFLSDNGYLWGEHGLQGKGVPYTPSVSVPMYMRWPEGSVAQGRVRRTFAANIDIAPTILETTGIAPDPAYPIDGRSLLGGGQDRDVMFTEEWASSAAPRWASLRTNDYQYVEYYAGDGFGVVFREFYDLRADPWQLDNLLGDADANNDPSHLQLAQLSIELARASRCTGTTGLRACP